MSNLPAGALVDHYVVDEVITQGGFAWAYFVRNSSGADPEQYFLKELFPENIVHRVGQNVQLSKPEYQKHLEVCQRGFEKELNVLSEISTIDGVNIPRLIDAFAANNTFYIVQERIVGVTLDKWFRGEVKPRGSNGMGAILECVLSLLSTLDVLHRLHKLHRDIKPSNILVDANGRPFLVDFGAARLEIDSVTHNIADRAVTPGFASLEQSNASQVNQQEQGPYTDLYSVAAAFYFLFFNKVPPESLARSLGQSETLDFLTLSDTYDEEFLRTLNKAFSLLPRDRYRSAQDWMSDLEPLAKKYRVNVSANAAELEYQFEVGKTAGEDPRIHRVVFADSQWISRLHLQVRFVTRNDGSIRIAFLDKSSNGTTLTYNDPNQGQVSRKLNRDEPFEIDYRPETIVQLADVSLTLSQLLLRFADETRSAQVAQAVRDIDNGTQTRMMGNGGAMGYDFGDPGADSTAGSAVTDGDFGASLFTFKGRSTRSRFWRTILFTVLLSIALQLVSYAVGYSLGSSGMSRSDAEALSLFLGLITGGIIGWVSLANFTKRFRDTGMSRSTLILCLVVACIPLLSLVTLIVAGFVETDAYNKDVYGARDA